MSTFQQRYNQIAQGALMQARLTIAIVDAAGAIVTEDPGTSNHANRLIWAGKVLKSFTDAQWMSGKMLFDLWQNASIAANGDASTDGDIQFVVNGLVSDAAAIARYNA
jgi:hypothetical protein